MKIWLTNKLKSSLIFINWIDGPCPYQAVVVVIAWYDLQLPMQSVPTTTNVVSSNPTQEGWTQYNIASGQ